MEQNPGMSPEQAAQYLKGALLAGPPDEMLLAQTAGLSGDDTELGQAIGTLAKLARVTKPKAAESE
ncbi:MAG: molecular chaperone TorD, partial [Pseudomonadota bacterium]